MAIVEEFLKLLMVWRVILEVSDRYSAILNRVSDVARVLAWSVLNVVFKGLMFVPCAKIVGRMRILMSFGHAQAVCVIEPLTAHLVHLGTAVTQCIYLVFVDVGSIVEGLVRPFAIQGVTLLRRHCV